MNDAAIANIHWLTHFRHMKSTSVPLESVCRVVYTKPGVPQILPSAENKTRFGVCPRFTSSTGYDRFVLSPVVCSGPLRSSGSRCVCGHFTSSRSIHWLICFFQNLLFFSSMNWNFYLSFSLLMIVINE